MQCIYIFIYTYVYTYNIRTTTLRKAKNSREMREINSRQRWSPWSCDGITTPSPTSSSPAKPTAQVMGSDSHGELFLTRTKTEHLPYGQQKQFPECVKDCRLEEQPQILVTAAPLPCPHV